MATLREELATEAYAGMTPEQMLAAVTETRIF